MIVTYESSYCWEGKIYFFARELNALFNIDIKTARLSYVTSVDSIDLFGKYLFTAIAGVKNKIVLAPRSAQEIVVYDIYTGEMHNYLLGERFKYINSKFQSVAQDEASVFMVGSQYPGIVRFYPFTGEQVFFNNWYTKFEDIFSLRNNIYFHNKSTILLDKTLYSACAFTNKILGLSIDTGEAVLHTIDGTNSGFSCMCFDGVYFWLSPFYGNIMIRWNPETGRTDTILLPNENGHDKLSYHACLIWKDYVLVSPVEKNPFCIISRKTLKITTFPISDIFQERMSYRPEHLYPIMAEQILENGNCLIHAYPNDHYILKEECHQIYFTPLFFEFNRTNLEKKISSWISNNTSMLLLEDNTILDLKSYISIIRKLTPCQKGRQNSKTDWSTLYN